MTRYSEVHDRLPPVRRVRARRWQLAGAALAVGAFAASPGAAWAAPGGGSPSQVDIDLDLCGTTIGVLDDALGTCDAVPPEDDDLLDDLLDLDLLDGDTDGELLDGDLLEVPLDEPLLDVTIAEQEIATVDLRDDRPLLELGLLRDSDGVDDVADLDTTAGDGIDADVLRGELATATVDLVTDAPATATAALDLCGTSVAVAGSADATCPDEADTTAALRTCDAPVRVLGCSSPAAAASTVSLCGIGVSVGTSIGTSCFADVPEGAPTPSPETPAPSNSPTPGAPPAPGDGDDSDDGAAAGGGAGDDGQGSGVVTGVAAGAGAPAQDGGLPVTGSSIGLFVVFGAALVTSGLVAWRFRNVRID